MTDRTSGGEGGLPPSPAPRPGLLGDCAPYAPKARLGSPSSRQPLHFDGAGAPVATPPRRGKSWSELDGELAGKGNRGEPLRDESPEPSRRGRGAAFSPRPSQSADALRRGGPWGGTRDRAPQAGETASSRLVFQRGKKNDVSPYGDEERYSRFSYFTDIALITLVIALGLVILTGCQTTDSVPEPRLLTGAPVLPICLAICQINQSLVSHEKIEGDGVTATTTGGTVSGSQSRGGQ